MAAYYYDSGNTSDPSRDGSEDHPFLDFSELPTPNRITDSQNSHYIRCGTETNLTAALISTSATTQPIVISSWGSGARPIITAYRMLDSNECVEVSVDISSASYPSTPATITEQSGTNLWRVPKTFFGLFFGEIWGAATDPWNRAGAGEILPAADREWCGAVAGGITDDYGIIYSIGNPVQTYGGVVVSSFDEGVWGTESEQCTFATKLAIGGFELSSLDLRLMHRASRAYAGTTSEIYNLALHSYHDLTLTSIFRGINLNIGETYAPYVKHASVRAYDIDASNLGASLIDTSGGLESCFNDMRVYRFVVNGFCKAYSTGCIYIAAGSYTTDGGRILVYDGTLCNGDGGHFWPTDGHACYQEQYSRNVEFLRIFIWNCRLACIANLGGGNVVFRDIVAFAPDGIDEDLLGSYYNFLTINSGNGYGSHHVSVLDNIASGFVRFAVNNYDTNAYVNIKRNISLGGGALGSGNGAYYEAIRSETNDTARINIDGNNFFGHLADLRNYNTGTTYNSAPEVNNRITSDPSAELARLPTPTDPTVNYALQIRPGARIVNGVVDLRPGTRVAA